MELKQKSGQALDIKGIVRLMVQLTGIEPVRDLSLAGF